MGGKSKYIFLLGLSLIITSGILLAANHFGFALKLIYISFWILVAGNLVYILELKNEK